MRLRILPYKIGSQGAKLLAQSLGVLRIHHAHTRFRPRLSDVLVNWGGSTFHPQIGQTTYEALHSRGRLLNHPTNVRLASNKISAFSYMQANSVSIPEYTTSIDTARGWFSTPNTFVYCRRTVTGFGGAGIVVAKTPEELVYAPLYTKGIVCRREYRVHVLCNNVIDTTRKARRMAEGDSTQDCGELVRNHDANWVYQRSGFEIPEGLRELAVSAVKACGLHFGAVDIVVEKNTGNQYVLEVNTAPGICGTTVELYKSAILNYVGRL